MNLWTCYLYVLAGAGVAAADKKLRALFLVAAFTLDKVGTVR